MSQSLTIRGILDLYPEQPGFHCVGTTQAGNRCRNSFIRRAYLDEASKIIDDLPQTRQQNTSSHYILTILRRLAWLTLCPRWHQNDRPGVSSQANAIASRWLRILESSTIGEIYSARPSTSSIPQPRTFNTYSQAAYTQRPGSRVSSNDEYIPMTPPRTPPIRQDRAAPTGAMAPPSSSQNIFGARRQNLEEDRSVRININVAVNGSNAGQSGQGTSRSNTEQGINRPSPGSSTNDHSTLLPSPRMRGYFSATTDQSQASTNNRSRGHSDDVRMLRLQLQLLETQLALERATRSPRNNPEAIRTPQLSPSMSVISDSSPPSSGSRANNHAAGSPLGQSPVSIISGASSTGINTPNTSAPPSPFVRSQNLSLITQSIQGSSRTNVGGRVIRRQPIRRHTECYVCYEPILRYPDAVWCRGGCGQNVCVECFELWSFYQEDDEHEVTCGFCRAPWVY